MSSRHLICLMLVVMVTAGYRARAQNPPAPPTSPPTQVAPGQAPETSDTMGVKPNPAPKHARPGKHKKHAADGANEKSTEPARDEATHTGGLVKPGSLPTAQNQSRAAADADLTRRIRRALVKDHLSMRAKNLTIITNQGLVTLRGSVNSKSELRKVNNVVRGIAKNVKSEITVRK